MVLVMGVRDGNGVGDVVMVLVMGVHVGNGVGDVVMMQSYGFVIVLWMG